MIGVDFGNAHPLVYWLAFFAGLAGAGALTVAVLDRWWFR